MAPFVVIIGMLLVFLAAGGWPSTSVGRRHGHNHLGSAHVRALPGFMVGRTPVVGLAVLSLALMVPPLWRVLA